MDLLIENEYGSHQLSTMGVVVTDVQPNSPTMNATRQDINFKNGKLWSGATYEERKVSVEGYYYSEDEYDELEMRDRMNFLFMSNEPMYIAPMYKPGGLYSYERPGERTGAAFQNFSEGQYVYKYRWHVIADGEISFDFQGMSSKGLLTKFSLTFVTADIPFGMTVPQDEVLTGKNFISYEGTAAVSQLDWPFYLELHSTADQSGKFEITIDEKTFKYESDQNIKVSDIFELKGISFTLNGLNVNDKTNYEYFELLPNRDIKLETNFTGDVYLRNKIEFYV